MTRSSGSLDAAPPLQVVGSHHADEAVRLVHDRV
jgi:hypothetical protein